MLNLITRSSKKIVIPTAICVLVELVLLISAWNKGHAPFSHYGIPRRKGSSTPEHASSWHPAERPWSGVGPRNSWDSNDICLIQRPKNYPAPSTHREITSISTTDGAYIMINWGPYEAAINPNIIPHPRIPDLWIVVAQQMKSHSYPHYADDYNALFTEIFCLARFENQQLVCIYSPSSLPISSTPPSPKENCEDNAHFILQMSLGPHDARVINGPEYPLIIYGEKSQHVCFGIWMQDFRVLVDWGFEPSTNNTPKQAVEIKRPHPTHSMEKNYFPFWDAQGEMYAHFDIAPQRAFAKLHPDGTTGEDLAPLSRESDEKCMKAYMPSIGEQLEGIHQATNALSLTLCNRSSTTCVPSDSNTFIMSIFQWKSYWGFHGQYEPYLALFHRTPPFALYGFSDKPFWVRGRGGKGEGRIPDPNVDDERKREWDQSEMVYFTSMNWREHGVRWHGYVDDVVLLGFGVEDNYTALVDLTAGDLLADLRLCGEEDDTISSSQ